jgi:conjugative relaxase-like TrwC/TraI family protein
MMSMSPGGLNADQAETYFKQHYSRDDYYTEGQTCVGRWVGEGAAALGLTGDVEHDDFTALLQGTRPHSGAVLVPAATHNGKHVAGWDSVFSAPKSVSIQALVGGDLRLMEAHRQAVQHTISEVEHFALAHQKGASRLVVSGNILAAAFDHLAARPANGATPDPQLHTHVVLLNVTRRPDGQWRGLDPIEIYRSQTFGSAVYRSTLAREVQRLGYHIQVTSGNGKWELEGYTREQVMAFSRRRQDIEKQMAEAGYKGARAAQIVTLDSRRTKGNYNEAELKADWKTRAVEYGIDAGTQLSQALKAGDTYIEDRADTRAAVEFSRTHTTEREAVVDRRALEAAALQHGMGRVELVDVRKEITARERNHSLIRAKKPDWQTPRGAFTTDEMRTLESENLSLVRGRAPATAMRTHVHLWAWRKGLSHEQTDAAKLALASRHWATAIEGLAGTAKTTTVGAIREFAVAQGYAVRGFGMSTGSVKALREAGVYARTVDSLITHPLPAFAERSEHEKQLEAAGQHLAPGSTPPEVWIVDESSLLSTVKIHQLLTAAREQGAARIIFVGDQHQHHAIEAGAPLRQFLADNMAVAYLTTIRRQKDVELRRAVETMPKKPAEAFALLEKQNRITEIADAATRYKQIAADYLDATKAGQKTLVVSPGNDERRALNQEIRNTLVETGFVRKDGREHEILVRRDLTKAQLRHARNYQQGDVIHFNRGNKQRGIASNSYLTVEAVHPDHKLLTLQSNHGPIEFMPARWGSLQVYTREQRTLAIGDRVQFRKPDKRHDIANGEFATVAGLDAKKVELQFEDGRKLALPFSQLQHIDHGYCSTSHASQGSTVDRVIINVDSMRSSQLVNRKQFYVSISRAREDARVYTNNLETLRRSAQRQSRKETALDAIDPQHLKPRQRLLSIKQQLVRTQGLGWDEET